MTVHLTEEKPHALLILDSGACSARSLAKAGYGSDPRTDGSLEGCRVIEVDMSQMTQDALKDAGLTKKEALRCKNLWALGLVYWMFGRRRQATVDWLNGMFQTGRAPGRDRVWQYV